MAKRIQYDNFKTVVRDENALVMTPEGPAEVTMRVLSLIDSDDGTVHEFAYPLEAAEQVGVMLQTGDAEQAQAAGGPKVRTATTAEMNILTQQPHVHEARPRSGGPVVGG